MKTKEILKDFVPPIILKVKQYLFNKKQEQISPFYNLVKINNKFKDIHKQERVFILASGPSIKEQNLKPLKNENCIAVSHFHLHEDIKIIKPQYHILAPQHPPFTFNDSSKYFTDFKKAYSENKTTFFLGLTGYKYNYLELLEKNPELRIPNLHFLDYSLSPQLNEFNYLNNEIWDISKRPFAMRTVIYGAIQLAYYMGFSEIYLLGVDHDYLKDTTRIENHHFYKEEKGISDKNHLKEFTTERWFFEYYSRWKQYRLMKEFLLSQNIKIFNATPKSMLDVFDYISLNDALKQQ